jgi:hypothetical protein
MKKFAFSSPIMRTGRDAVKRLCYLGLVADADADDFFAADLFDVRRLVLVDDLLAAGDDAPDATRVECFARCLRAFFGAASAMGAIAPSAKTVMNATTNNFTVLRIIVNLKRYLIAVRTVRRCLLRC